MLDVLLDAVLDTLKVFPFLLLIYILIEILEHRTTLTQNRKILQGGLAPLIGSATGIIPQCGFSVMAAKLYDRGLIKTGTVMAVFLATSDEALIIMLADMRTAKWVMPLILIKLIVAVGAGYLINFILSNERTEEIGMLQNPEMCGNDHGGKSEGYIFFVSPLLHSLKIALYLLIVNLVFGYIMFATEDAVSSLMIGGTVGQPFITALIGLIPNCASSVILAGAFANGGITFGSFVGGLCANAGLGLVILIRNAKKLKRNILFIITLYLVSVVVGVAVNGLMLLF